MAQRCEATNETRQSHIWNPATMRQSVRWTPAHAASRVAVEPLEHLERVAVNATGLPARLDVATPPRVHNRLGHAATPFVGQRRRGGHARAQDYLLPMLPAQAGGIKAFPNGPPAAPHGWLNTPLALSPRSPSSPSSRANHVALAWPSLQARFLTPACPSSPSQVPTRAQLLRTPATIWLPLTLLGAFDRARSRQLTRLGFVSRNISTPFGNVHVLERPRRGHGPTWVFAHGFSGQGSDWAQVIPHLHDKLARIILLDLPGHGRSQPSRLGGDIISGFEQTGITALNRLLAEDADPCVMVGISMGGLAAAGYSFNKPDKVQGTVLINSLGAAMTSEQLNELITRLQPRNVRALTSTSALLGRHRVMRRLCNWVMSASLARPYQQALLRAYRSYGFLTPAQLCRLPEHTLYVSGGNDNLINGECQRFFRDYLPATAARIHHADFDHLPIFSAPNALADTILSWVTQTAPQLLLQAP